MASAAPVQPILLAGPTAVGKSELAMLLAERLSGEIVSVDSMQVYRGLDIGTAKPSTEDLKRVRHHLIDILNLDAAFDAAQFNAHAQAAVADIQSRARVPILCGGTGLYFRAFRAGVGSAPSPDPVLRAELEQMPSAGLLAELAAKDPALFDQIDQANRRRLVRALEVIRITGRPASQQRALWNRVPDQILWLLTREPDDLRARIDQRVDRMFDRGLVEETRSLIGQGLDRNRVAKQALGYRQVLEFLEGRRTLAETIYEVKRRTWQFARRQGTWFRKEQRIEPVAIDRYDTAESIADRLVRLFEKNSDAGR